MTLPRSRSLIIRCLPISWANTVHLKSITFDILLSCVCVSVFLSQEMTSGAHRRVVVEYMKAVMQKRITFKSPEERKDGADRMIKESDQFKLLFRKLSGVRATCTARFSPNYYNPNCKKKLNSNKSHVWVPPASQNSVPIRRGICEGVFGTTVVFLSVVSSWCVVLNVCLVQSEETDRLCDAIAAIAEVFKLSDTTMLSLEVSTLVSKYPDIRSVRLKSSVYDLNSSQLHCNFKTIYHFSISI